MLSSTQQDTEMSARIPRRFDSLSACCEVLSKRILQMTDERKNCPIRKIICLKRGFSPNFMYLCHVIDEF